MNLRSDHHFQFLKCLHQFLYLCLWTDWNAELEAQAREDAANGDIPAEEDTPQEADHEEDLEPKEEQDMGAVVQSIY